MGIPRGSVVKNPPANAGDARDVGLIPGWGRSPGGGNGNPLQFSCLENPMDRGAWWATIHRVRKSQTQLSMHTQVNQDDLKSLNYITKTLLSNKLAFLSSGMWTYLSVRGRLPFTPPHSPKTGMSLVQHYIPLV